MSRRVALGSTLVIVVVVIAGCNIGKSRSRGSAAGHTPRVIGSGDVTLNAVDFDDVEKAIRDERGNVVVVDVWATW
jgi:hypothetical protein